MARAIAVDWSGARVGAAQRIWLAEAAEPGRLARLECGRDRDQMADHLAGLPPDQLVIGLDFAFSFPEWFIEQLRVRSAADLWAHVARCGEGWLLESRPPFWGRRGQPRPPLSQARFRRTELAVPGSAGIAPKSVFQIGGAGSVGTGSLRGMSLLHTLRTRGAAIWPFSEAGAPVVVEIYPRLMTGPVHKSDAAARAHLLERYPTLDAQHRRLATASEDAFDAAVSALVMVEHIADLLALPTETNPALQLEGRIWHPTWREDRL